MTGTLYIVATPIGNLQDISKRAEETLKNASAILCEDTRRTGILLKTLGIEFKKLVSYYEENELQRIPEVISFLKEGGDIALVSDAGTPTISDPGFKLVRECIKEGIKVESIPGPTAFVSALVSSGLPTDKFLFLGYPPAKPGHRKDFFEKVLSLLKIIKQTVIIYEAPHKLLTTLEDMKGVFGDIQVVVARELTKVHEEVRRESISEAIEHFKKTQPRGEFVILFSESF